MKERQPKLIKLDKNSYQYEDFYGNKSETYFLASEYTNGFAHVKKAKDSPVKQRDVLGRISSLKTISGVYFYRFMQGKMSFSDLPDKYFLDDIFFEGVKLALLDRIAQKIQEKTQKGEHINIREIKKQKDAVIDACIKKRNTALAQINKNKQNINEILGG